MALSRCDAREAVELQEDYEAECSILLAKLY